MFDWIKTKTFKNRKDFGKFNFHVKSQPQFIDSSTTLTLTTYANVFQNATIPCVYRWSIIKNGYTVQRHEFKGSSFKCEPSDVGAIIQAQVISTDLEYGGTAIIHIGPIRLDINLKKHIQVALASGCAIIPVHIVHGIQERQCQIKLFQDLVKINHIYSDSNFTFNYSLYEPQIQCFSKDSNRAMIRFGQKHHNQLKKFTKQLFDDLIKDFGNSARSNNLSHNSENNIQHLQIKFSNHASRDVFLFVWKAFNTKKQLRSTTIINKLQRVDFSKNETLDYILQIQSLKNDMMKMDQALKRSHQQKTKHIEQIHKLKQQIESIVLTYTRIIEQKNYNELNFSKDFSILSTTSNRIDEKKYRNLQNDNNHLNSRIHALTKQIDAIRFQPNKIQSVRISNQCVEDNKNFNSPYQSMKSPFSKKKTQDDSQGFIDMLQDLTSSRVTNVSVISSIRKDTDLMSKLEECEKQNHNLQKKLQMSFHQINKLEKQLSQNKNRLNDQSYRMNQSAINFNYNCSTNQSINLSPNNLNKSMIIQNQRQYLLNDNNQLKKNNQILSNQNKKLVDQLNKTRQQIYKEKSLSKSSSVYQLNESSNFFKLQNKASTHFQQKKQFNKQLQKQDNQINDLKTEIFNLRKENSRFVQELRLIKEKKIINENLQKKVNQLQKQLYMYKQNSDALNRSQMLSMEMQSFNDQQIETLKKHNEFLANQNVKLTRACQKYMNQAKQCNKLRMEIIKLRQRITNNQLY